MIVVRFSNIAEQQLNEIISNNSIYDTYGHFTQIFVNWNYMFHQYVNPIVLDKNCNIEHGRFNIGNIGILEYKRILLLDVEVIEIIQFRFSKLPYSKQENGSQYRIVANAGYGYKVVQSAFNGKHSILTPQKKYLTKFVFDNIIGFHHSSNAYNTIYAIGFINDRAYAIYQNGNIQVLPYTKDQYLNKKHKFYESTNSVVILESQLRRLIQESIKKILNII